ncbi:MAG: hypothetical protein JNL60_16625 [Bacteroidia bacterium]|nr:hypothetical protein [Bacteroidia bacterium]
MKAVIQNKIKVVAANALTLFLCMLLIGSCKKKDKEVEPETQSQSTPQPASISAMINGKTWTPVTYTAILAVDIEEKISALSFVSQTATEKISVEVFYDGVLTAPQTGNFTNEDAAFVSYNRLDVFRIYDNKDAGFNVNSSSATSKTFSGSFSYLGVTNVGTNNQDTVEITNGTFKNIPFTIVNEDL